jgi:Tetratricopeptide repeat
MNNIALIYRCLCQMKEAAELHEKVLEASQRMGMEHPNTSHSMNDLASTYPSLGQMRELFEHEHDSAVG